MLISLVSSPPSISVTKFMYESWKLALAGPSTMHQIHHNFKVKCKLFLRKYYNSHRVVYLSFLWVNISSTSLTAVIWIWLPKPMYSIGNELFSCILCILCVGRDCNLWFAFKFDALRCIEQTVKFAGDTDTRHSSVQFRSMNGLKFEKIDRWTESFFF